MKSMKKIRIRSYEGETIIYEKNTCNGCSKNRFPDRFRGSGLFFILNLFMAVVPSLQTLVIADFVDQVMALGSADTQNRKVLLLIFFLVALVAYSWISKSLTELVGQHIEMRLRAIFKPWLVEKISRLKYEAMENESIRDKISRINTNAEVQVREAYSCLLRLLGLILKVAGILVIMLSQVWWLAFLLLIVSIPCFRIAMKSGKEDYEAQADVTKVSRVNEYYNEMLKKGNMWMREPCLDISRNTGISFYISMKKRGITRQV